MKIGIGNDHVAIDMKNFIVNHLKLSGHEVIDYGTNDSGRTDYPIYGERVAQAVLRQEIELGILICGTGIGISLAANKMHGIRAAVCSDPYSARLSREHNNTNIISFGSRVVGTGLAAMIVDAWLTAGFQGGRHQRRIDMISDIEKKQQEQA